MTAQGSPIPNEPQPEQAMSEPLSDCCGAVETSEECDRGFSHGGICSACRSEDASFNIYPLPQAETKAKVEMTRKLDAYTKEAGL